MTEVNMGGTAIGTGINAPVGYVDVVIPLLAELSGVPVTRAADLIAATADTGSFVDVSGTLKRIAVKLSKISNDLRLLSSGRWQRAGSAASRRAASALIMASTLLPALRGSAFTSISCSASSRGMRRANSSKPASTQAGMRWPTATISSFTYSGLAALRAAGAVFHSSSRR